MLCPHCGAQLDEGAVFCSKCGAQLNANQPNYNFQQPYPPQPETDPGKEMGLISLILSAASFVVPTGIILPLIGAILGYMARNKSKAVGIKNDFALIGMILGIVQCAVCAVALVLVFIYIFIYFVFVFGFLGIGLAGI